MSAWRRDLRPLGESKASLLVSVLAKIGRFTIWLDVEDDEVKRVECMRSTADRKSLLDITREKRYKLK